jgi:APA family basic amino acid/polyamine antiporter
MMNQPKKTDRPDSQAAPARQLSLFDSTCIIVGIIIGSGIYETSPKIAAAASGLGAKFIASAPWLGRLAEQSALVAGLLSDQSMIIGVWVLGGILSLLGALCYAELAAAYPKSGGDYVYLTRAFGREMGFLFAWAQLWVVRPGSIGLYAYVFARYANQIWKLGDTPRALVAYAAGSIVVLTLVNMLGVREGKWTQNVLTVIKVVGLGAIFVVGLFCGSPEPPPATGQVWSNLGLAMIFVFYTYGGWNEMAYVGAEVRNPQKNILRALVLGTVAVAGIYVLVNAAFLRTLGVTGLSAASTDSSRAVAADLLNMVSPWGGRMISVLICISALGAINGMIFTGARIYYAMGTEHRLYAWLGRWDQRRGSPLISLLSQAVVTLLLVVGFGWRGGAEGFDALLAFTSPVFWGFFLLVGLSLFALRECDRDLARPYRVPLFPLVPILFCLSSLFMLYSSINYAMEKLSSNAYWAVGILGLGVLLTFFDPRPTEE